VTGAQGEEADEPTLQDRWVVQKRWVDDLELYNELMEELDYEIVEDLVAQVPLGFARLYAINLYNSHHI
jgi:hypothetical protein